jgi:FMN reductase
LTVPLGISGAVVVGNPKPGSRTLDAATKVAERLGGRPPDLVLDLVELGPGLLGWGDEAVGRAVASVQEATWVVVASPTYKAAYTGLLKLFLDQFAAGSLAGVVAFPLMLGGAWSHALAPEVFLKPVLAELGASCPMPGLYLLDSDYESPAGLEEWVESARRFI